MSEIYKNSKIWLTIDVEEIVDTNFSIDWKSSPKVDYEKLIDNWIELNERLEFKSTCFVLGTFAQKYPNLIKKLSENGHEIASHGLTHELVYNLEFSKWKSELITSKKILEDLIGKSVSGYRSPSWSLPFEKKYYETLAQNGFEYSSSYFPIKTYMYGNSIDKKEAFKIYTDSGVITEIPIAKYKLPFSGGFYLRVLPLLIEKFLFKKSISSDIKPIIYIHPYELIKDKSLIGYFLEYAKVNIDFILAFYSSTKPIDKIEAILNANK